MRHSIVRWFLSTSSGDGAAHADGLHLPAWICNSGVSRHAHGVARTPSPHLLLAGLAKPYTGRTTLEEMARWTPTAITAWRTWAPYQSSLLERASAR